MKGVILTFAISFLASIGVLLAVQNVAYPWAATSRDPNRIEAPAFLLEHLAAIVAIASAMLLIVSVGMQYKLKQRERILENK